MKYQDLFKTKDDRSFIRTTKILMIDDNPISTVPLVTALSQMGLEVDYTHNQILGVELMASEQYDLIILDWRMPDIDGYDSLLKAEATLYREGKSLEGRKIPYIIYSGLEESQVAKPMTRKFEFIEHWQKNVPAYELCKRAGSALGFVLSQYN